MEKPSKQKGETKKVPPVYSEEKLKALETAVNWIRNRQVFLIRQIQKNDISDKKLQEIGHFDKKLIVRFETGVISVIKLIEMKETIIAILHEKDIQEQVNMHEKGHRERDFYAAYMALEHNQTIEEREEKISAFKMTDKFIQSTHFVENINILIQNGDIHLKQ
ncbi:MAG: hypothetical protein EGS53_08100 [Prevotella sp.]|nr:hypothetical protein [Prevotella sp.]